MTDIKKTVLNLAAQAKDASRNLAITDIKTINAALNAIGDSLRLYKDDILAANKKDMDAAKENGLSDALIDRLMLDDARIDGMAKGAMEIAQLPDPVGKVLSSNTSKDGFLIEKVSVPIGVLGMIYEARPNVTIDAACLALKSRNAIVLRGGADAFKTCIALHKIVELTLAENGLPKEVVSMVPTADRDAVGQMLGASDFIDVMIPRGGRSLIERVQKDARMPVFSHLDGVCHVYVHKDADAQMALGIVLNSKMQRVGVCNAAETLLIDKNFADARLILDTLIDSGCEIVGDDKSIEICNKISPATNDDWGTEYLAPKISVKIVNGVDEAIEHINKYGSGHTDAIISNNQAAADKFLARVDSGSVMHNVSTRFADGGCYGLGAEIGISTGKMHARGPVGAGELTTYKYIVRGDGQIR